MKTKVLYLLVVLLALVCYIVSNNASNNVASVTEKIDTTDNVNLSKVDKSGVELPDILDGKDEQIVSHTGYTLSYNIKHNTPNWVAWQLTSEHTDGNVGRSTKFWPDPSIAKPYRVDYFDYKDSGYDRGHMCPAGDNKWSEEAMHDCFYMSNMCPQEPSLNSGAWKKLEEACRKWAVSEGCIYIVCGPIYSKKGKPLQIGINHSISVPDGFFKAVLSLRKGEEKAIGFYYSNTTDKQPMKAAAMSVDELEKLAKMDFFHTLDDALEDRLESTFSLNDWR